MPISDWNFGEKDSVTSCAPTDSKWKNRTLIIFVFDYLWSIGTYIKLVTTKSTNFFLTFEKVGQLRSYDVF